MPFVYCRLYITSTLTSYLFDLDQSNVLTKGHEQAGIPCQGGGAHPRKDLCCYEEGKHAGGGREVFSRFQSVHR
ncbi:MAG: hypothetical protein JRN37_02875 [Nitrososphaerota archaeon]|nr:hypothetical protein [Nitrososphaerota archaeon]MDG7038093.1 hypothetical protein [Nitrososphaerota archaeon]